MRKLLLLLLLLVMAACSQAQPTTKTEGTKQSQEPIITHGMLAPGYNPTVPDSAEVVGMFDPMASLENAAFLDGKAYMTSILGNKIYIKDLSTPPSDYSTLEVPNDPNTFMAGIDVANGQIIFATATFAQDGPPKSKVFTLNPTTLAYSQLTEIPGAALNGLGILKTSSGTYWLSIDALQPSGVIWKGLVAPGGEVSQWYTGEAAMPNAAYIPTTCNPPMPVGGNGLVIEYLFGQWYVVVSNTTGSGIWAIPILPNGSAGQAWKWYDQLYPDDIWPDGCGLPIFAFPHGTWVSGHGLHKTYWINPYTQERVLIADGTLCNGNTSVRVYNNKLYLICAADVLICGPDENGDPDPSVQNPGIPILLMMDLDQEYIHRCRP